MNSSCIEISTPSTSFLENTPTIRLEFPLHLKSVDEVVAPIEILKTLSQDSDVREITTTVLIENAERKLSDLLQHDLKSEHIYGFFNKVKKEIINFSFFLKYFFVSLTSSDSLFFRFSSIENDFEFKLEVFYDFDVNDSEDIEAILHVYKSDLKKEAYYGSIEYLFSIIREKSEINTTIFWSKEAVSIVFNAI